MEEPGLPEKFEAGGKSKATIDGRIVAIGAFINFLETIILSEYQVLQQEIYQKARPVGDICNVKIFQEFETFLMNTVI